MRFIESGYTDPYLNLALEDYIFSSLDRSESYFMLWQNEPSVIVGRFQNTAEEIDRAYTQAHAIKVARRLSGGGAVYHDLGNLNYSFIVDEERNRSYDFSFFSQSVLKALTRFGIEAKSSGRNDLTIAGAKFSGSAQYVRDGRVMHHGCIMVTTDLSVVGKVLKPKDIKFASKAVKSVRSRVTNIEKAAGKALTLNEFRHTLLEEVARKYPLVSYQLSESDAHAASELAHNKYATWEWNWGASPKFSLEKTLKFEAGIISAHINVRAGKIEAISLSGDFFGNRSLAELENKLVGCTLDDTLESVLEELRIEDYLHGTSAHELAQLLRS